MNNDVIAANLRRIRASKRFSQEQVAEAASLSRSAYRNIEGGTVQPRVRNLEAIARALQVPVRELLEPAAVLSNVGFRSQKKLRTRAQILSDAGRWLSVLTIAKQRRNLMAYTAPSKAATSVPPLRDGGEPRTRRGGELLVGGARRLESVTAVRADRRRRRSAIPSACCSVRGGACVSIERAPPIPSADSFSLRAR